MVNRPIVFRAAALALLPMPAFAQTPSPLGPPAIPVISDPSTLTAAYETLVGAWFTAVSPYAYDLFAALAAVDIAVFGWDLWRTHHGDLRSALFATANKVMIVGFFLALLMNGGTWMADIINMFTTIGKTASGIPGLGPSVILLQGFKIFGTLLWQATKNGFMADFPTAIALVAGAFVICAAFLVITIQFIVTKVQTFLVLSMGFFFLGFGGSRWTVPYVERYFAFAVASGTKLMMLYVLTAAGWSVTNNWVTAAGAAAGSQASATSCWLIACGAVIYAVIVWFGSSTFAAMLGGSPNLSHSDFVSFIAPMISAGVSAGLIAAGIGTGGASTAAGAAMAAAGSTASSAGKAAGNPSGASPAQPSPSAGTSSNGSGGSSGVAAASAIAQVGISAVSRMPHGGGHQSPPHFNGFGH